MSTRKQRYKIIRVKIDTWKALTYLRAHFNLPSYDQVIRYLIRYYRDKELRGQK